MIFPLFDIVPPPEKQPGAIWAILALSVGAFVLSWCFTLFMKHFSPRIGFVDKPGGRKIHANPKPLGGGVAIFWAFSLPMLIGLAVIVWGHPPARFEARIPHLDQYWSGMRERAPMAIGLLLAALVMHVMGLIDDRKALGPYSKLLVQLGTVTALVLFLPELRVLTALGGAASAFFTILWINHSHFEAHPLAVAPDRDLSTIDFEFSARAGLELSVTLVVFPGRETDLNHAYSLAPAS